ncbi:DUF4199 domain-containing protein [Carboxylicivirga sp. M1479]|uniref:DUF4199 domain-containing protein n=1 Tax=Carboxylicivirga sp. M1479 TaxID=2594476 RepID=UPI001178C4B8|nr:DUF4199 domain-containing protein [Carboxylicivirga sp. M1479]TRX65985.1 DUF4199 domain-containing protein [Carboxylicivirga sp. M1479]
MENQNPSIGKSALNYGLFLGLALVVYSLIIYLAGLTGNQAASWLSYIIFIGIMSYAMINYRDKVNGGVLRYSQGLGLGILTAVVGGVISTVFTFILMKYIDPALIDQIVNKALEDAMAKGTPEEQMEMVEKMVRMFTSPTALLLMGVFGSALMGTIISLILAAIFKKEPAMFDRSEIMEEA